MALTSTLFTGLSGLQVNQNRLNVTGNNIANVNTVGFKSSRALAKPQFYVTDASASAPTSDFGGTNPDQRGLGALTSTIDRNWENGALETTGRSTDLALDGDGMFIVRGGGNGPTFTRDGSFNLNQNNQLVTSDGRLVQGYGIDEAGRIDRTDTEDVVIPIGGLTKAKETNNVEIKGVLDAGGVAADNASILVSQELVDAGGGPIGPTTLLADVRLASNPTGPALFTAGDTLELGGEKGSRTIASQTFTIDAATDVAGLSEFFNETFGISNTLPEPSITDAGGAVRNAGLQVDVDAVSGATTLAFIAQKGDGMSVALNTEGGGFNNLDNPAMNLAFDSSRPLADGTQGGSLQEADAASFGESSTVSTKVYDTLGNEVLVDMTMVLDSKDNGGTTWRFYAESRNDTDIGFDPGNLDNGRVTGGGTLRFDNDGKFVSSTNGFVNIARDETGAGTPLRAELNFDQLSAPAVVNEGEETLRVNQDGAPVGTLTGFTVGENGVISGSFTNGLSETLGQVAVAVFDNPGGLSDLGGNYFAASAISGDPGIVEPLAGRAGGIRQGTLEMSNVDLSGEFINMIISTTGFSAASRVITTSDELLNELIASVR